MTRFVLVGLILLTAACAHKYPPPLTVEQQTNYKLQQVVVIYPDQADLWWGNGERQLAAADGRDLSDALAVDAYMDTPGAERALRDLAIQRIEPIIFRQVNPVLAGDQPAQLSVRVDSAHVSSSAQLLLIGGNHGLVGDAQLFDMQTGVPLTPPLRVVAFSQGGGGIIGAVVDATRPDGLSRTAGKFGQTVRRWLAAQREVDLGLEVAPPDTKIPPLPGPQATAQ